MLAFNPSDSTSTRDIEKINQFIITKRLTPYKQTIERADMNEHHYETESHMRARHPYIANHLATIANEQDGRMVAILDGKTYSWNA